METVYSYSAIVDRMSSLDSLPLDSATRSLMRNLVGPAVVV